MKKGLKDVRVLDLSDVLAGSVASMILRDLGAEIIHIEPPKGDDSREFDPFIGNTSALKKFLKIFSIIQKIKLNIF